MDEQKKYQVYFVATPIGNLSEITLRALEALKSADVVFCEDTRHAQKLFTHYGLTKKLQSYHKFNEKSRFNDIFEYIDTGKTIAVISDAGMPAISDPGVLLISELIDRNISYTVVSGASAFVNAFVLSGFNAPFTFFGFLPEKNKRRDELFANAGNFAMIFYSSPHSVNDDLKYLFQKFGKRKVAVVKEISKLFETVTRGTLGEITITAKGEYVIVVDKADGEASGGDPFTIFNEFIAQGMEKMEAIKKTAAALQMPKQKVYQIINEFGETSG